MKIKRSMLLLISHLLFTSQAVVFLYKLRYIVGFGLVEMAISTNPKPMYISVFL